MEGQLALIDLGQINCVRSMEPFDHSKLFTVDGEWCAIGSPNWDARSMRLNFEILVECYDATTITKIDRVIDDKIREAVQNKETSKKGKSCFVRLRNAAARLLMPYL